MADLIKNMLWTAAAWRNLIGAVAHNLLERMGGVRDAAQGAFADRWPPLSEKQPEGRIKDSNQVPLPLQMRHSAEASETLNSVMSEAARRLTKEQTTLDGISQEDGAAREAQQEKVAALSYMVSQVARVIDGADHLDLSDHAYYQGNTGSVESAESRHVAFIAEASDLIAKVETVGISVDAEFRVTIDPEWEAEVEAADAVLDRQEMERRDAEQALSDAEPDYQALCEQWRGPEPDPATDYAEAYADVAGDPTLSWRLENEDPRDILDDVCGKALDDDEMEL